MSYEQNPKSPRISVLGGSILPQNARISDYHPRADDFPEIFFREPKTPQRVVAKGLPSGLFARWEGVTLDELHKSAGEFP